PGIARSHMIVVSNTSPLTNMAAIGLFPLLQKLFTRIAIAEGVWGELNAFGQAWPGSIEVSAADWIERRSPQNEQMVIALRRDLDIGEAETIALALELDADLVLLDERDGRYAAQRMGLQVMGVLGILIAAKRDGHIVDLTSHLDALRQQAGFYLDDGTYRKVLTLAGE
ncbi:MAG: DUF3368 domain-containing protein, partial [Anaerolineales bacterium]|nr:DUF3368 domain-containing protein [Anaerolineales bacterium]